MRLSRNLTIRTTALALLIGAGAAPGDAAAGPLSDLIMSGKSAESAAPGLWRHERRVAAAEGGAGKILLDETLRYAPDPAPAAAEGEEEAGPRYLLSREPSGERLASFPGASSAPLAVYFLESAVNGASEHSTGNPFYIRTRLREAFVKADLGPLVEVETPEGAVRAHRAEVRPFAEDPNRPRMGEFADLTLVFEVTPEGRLLGLEAATKAEEGFRESLTLVAEP